MLTYQLRQFFKCGLEYNYRYRYWDAASVKKAVGQIEVCLEAYKNCDLYQLTFHCLCKLDSTAGNSSRQRDFYQYCFSSGSEQTF